jgi:non-homologous end joining protein Ku
MTGPPTLKPRVLVSLSRLFSSVDRKHATDLERGDLLRARERARPHVLGDVQAEEAEVADLMAALRESVKETQRKRKPTRKRARKTS